jgi:hypothetical protein
MSEDATGRARRMLAAEADGAVVRIGATTFRSLSTRCGVAGILAAFPRQPRDCVAIWLDVRIFIRPESSRGR